MANHETYSHLGCQWSRSFIRFIVMTVCSLTSANVFPKHVRGPSVKGKYVYGLTLQTIKMSHNPFMFFNVSTKSPNFYHLTLIFLLFHRVTSTILPLLLFHRLTHYLTCRRLYVPLAQWVNGSESVLTVWRSVLIVWGTHDDSKVNNCLYLIIFMLY